MMLVSDMLKSAHEHKNAGNKDNALLIYQSIIDINPRNIDALRGIGEIFIEQGNVKDAIASFEKAIAAGPNDALSHTMLAKIALAGGDLANAMKLAERALELDPVSADAGGVRAAIHLQNGEVFEAEQQLQASLAHHPDHPELLAALSQIILDAGYPEAALAHSQAALQQQPDKPEFLLLVGHQLMMLGAHKQSLPYLEKAYLGSPGNVLIMACLADVQASLGHLSEARRTAERIVTGRPDYIPGWQSYIKIMVMSGEEEAAFARFLPVMKKHANKIEAVLAIAAAYRIAGYADRSLQLLGSVLPRTSAMTADQKRLTATLHRDCLLTLGQVNDLQAAFPEVEIRRLSDETVNAVELAEQGRVAQDEPKPASDDNQVGAGILIGREVPALETLPLLRFTLGQHEGRVQDIYAPSALQDIVGLLKDSRFHPTDVAPSSEEPIQPLFPLPAIMLLPEEERGNIHAAIPYMHAPADLQEKWAGSLAQLPRPHLAVVWNSTRPGLLLEDLYPELESFEGTLIGVNWDDGRHQLANYPRIIDAGVHFSSMADLAAVLAVVDGVIGPDGMAMHMAGAMARNGAVLTQKSAPWYWYAQDERSYWYPDIAVIRAPGNGHWAIQIETVRPQIAQFLTELHQRSAVSASHSAPSIETVRED